MSVASTASAPRRRWIFALPVAAFVLIAAGFFAMIQITLQPFNIPTNFGRGTTMNQNAVAGQPQV